MKLTAADLVVLSVLMFDRPMHGHELFKLLEERDVEDWANVSRPQVYYSLRKLADGGTLRAITDTADPLGPERIVYAPTRKAQAVMQTELAKPQWTEKRPPAPFITWLALALNANEEIVIEQIHRRDAFLTREIVREKAALKMLKKETGRDIAIARAMIKMTIKTFEIERHSLGELKTALVDHQ